MSLPNKLIRPSSIDPKHSVDLFDANRLNQFKEMYCVAAAILISEVDWYWENYLDTHSSNTIED